jgi:uncharacterized protein (TIGR03067 family)
MQTLLALLAASLLIAADQTGDRVPRKEPHELDGQWERTSRPATARVQDWDSAAGQTFAFFLIAVNAKGIDIKGDRLVFQTGAKPIALQLTINAQQRPKTVDAAIGKGEIVFRGIYEVGQDSLRLCFSRKDRPKEFNNTPTTPFLEFKRK